MSHNQVPQSRRHRLMWKQTLLTLQTANFCLLCFAQLVVHLFAYCRFSVLLLVLVFTVPHASVAMSSTVMSLFSGTRSKHTCLGANPTAGESSASLVGTGNAGAVSGNAAQIPLNPPPTRSFAQVASGGSAKRSGPAPPAFPRPQLRHGKPLIEDPNYASMERPAPTTPTPNVLYVDMRSS